MSGYIVQRHIVSALAPLSPPHRPTHTVPHMPSDIRTHFGRTSSVKFSAFRPMSWIRATAASMTARPVRGGALVEGGPGGGIRWDTRRGHWDPGAHGNNVGDTQ